jgi:hypothetical protein
LVSTFKLVQINVKGTVAMSNKKLKSGKIRVDYKNDMGWNNGIEISRHRQIF